MIAYMGDYPLVRFANGRLLPFDHQWLEDSLRASAQGICYDFTWLAGHVSESISIFLRVEYEESQIPVEVLERVVQKVLLTIGHPDLALEFRTLPAPTTLSLLDVAYAAGEGFELSFFQILETRLKEAVASGTQKIECHDLYDCVKLLKRAKNWRNDCSSLRNEIVCFMREQALHASGGQLQIELS